jgi:hypothetical protein
MSSPSTRIVKTPEPFGELRQHAEDTRAVALGRGGLARRQADFPLGHGEARQRVHHHQHVLALVAEVLRNGDGGEGRLDALNRRGIRRGHDHHAPGQALGPEGFLEEVPHLAAALADQGQHVDVRLAGSRDFAQQRALADAAAGEDAHPLALAAGQQSVERPQPEHERLGDAPPAQRGRRLAAGQGALAVDRLAQGVDHPPQQPWADEDRPRHGAGRHRVVRRDAVDVLQRHEDAMGALEADDLGRHAAPVAGADFAQLADADRRALRLDRQPRDADDPPAARQKVGRADAVPVFAQVQAHITAAPSAPR